MTVFSSQFVKALRSYLQARCADGERCTREEIAAALAEKGMVVSPVLVGQAVTDGAANTEKQAWSLFRGRFGGIREVDLEETARLQARQEKILERARKAAETRKARKAEAAE